MLSYKLQNDDLPTQTGSWAAIVNVVNNIRLQILSSIVTVTHIAKFMGPTRGPPGSYRPQMGPM